MEINVKKIVFFSIAAYGHTNPTIEVVRELVGQGHQVWYYSFTMFKEKIEETGARYIGCDHYLPPLRAGEEKKIGKDFASLLEMLMDTTMAMNDQVCQELKSIQPDCIVSDSMCAWGKLFAKRLNVPYVCSTTTFAFNQYTASMMKQGILELYYIITGMPRVKRKMKQLQAIGYPVTSIVELIQNDNDTDTIVFTSKEFQPLPETFSGRYSFVGPSIADVLVAELGEKKRKLVYISLGTINNRNLTFYRNCIKAFTNENVTVVMSVGEQTDIKELGDLPDNFQVKNRVSQIQILQQADVFVTHCGMNSVNESLYYRVPMVMYPQQSEQQVVAKRCVELGAGVLLKNGKANMIKNAVFQVMEDRSYQEQAEKLSDSFKRAGGAKRAAKAIVDRIKEAH